jgi:hypothetical protein
MLKEKKNPPVVGAAVQFLLKVNVFLLMDREIVCGILSCWLGDKRNEC